MQVHPINYTHAARYYPNGRLEDTVFAGNASSSWQAIQYGLELLKKGLVWRVGDGSQIRIWRDLWLPKPHSYRPMSNRGSCRLRRVAELLTEDGEWRMDVLQRHFSTMDIDEIMKIKASPNHGEDVLAWAPDRRGIFSVRSAYKLAWESNHRTSMCVASRAPDGKRVVWDTVWGCPAPPKVRVFAWRLITIPWPPHVLQVSDGARSLGSNEGSMASERTHPQHGPGVAFPSSVF